MGRYDHPCTAFRELFEDRLGEGSAFARIRTHTDFIEECEGIFGSHIDDAGQVHHVGRKG